MLEDLLGDPPEALYMVKIRFNTVRSGNHSSESAMFSRDQNCSSKVQLNIDRFFETTEVRGLLRPLFEFGKQI